MVFCCGGFRILFRVDENRNVLGGCRENVWVGDIFIFGRIFLIEVRVRSLEVSRREEGGKFIFGGFGWD